MGFRLSLEHANWLAHILEPVGGAPMPPEGYERRYDPNLMARRSTPDPLGA